MNGNRRKGIVIQERDRRLLRELSLLRVMDREQVKIVGGFGSTTRANLRLLTLTRAGLLRRFFFGTVAGGRKAIYALSLKGAALVDVPLRGPRRRQDEVLVADFFVTHQLLINEIHCLVKYQPIPFEGAKFARWQSFHEPLLTGNSLTPDGYCEIATQKTSLAAFLEVDLGNESGSVWKTKVQAYVRYAVSEKFAEQFGKSRFRVLAVTNSERRMHALRRATLTVTDKIFWFTTLGSVKREGFWSPIWLRVKGSDRQSLL
jgi:hypothetical protein